MGRRRFLAWLVVAMGALLMPVRAAIGRLDELTGGTDQYGLYAASSDSTVIIDGTSNMFKVAATGTLSMNVNADSTNSTSVTLTALGSGFTEVPAFLGYINFGTETLRRLGPASSNFGQGIYFVANSSGGATTTEVTGLGSFASAEVIVTITAGELVVYLFGVNGLASTLAMSARYYVLQEAGI